jgi:hypothetical protein
LFLVFYEPDPKHTVVESPTAAILMLCLLPIIYVGISTAFFLGAWTLGTLAIPMIAISFAGCFYVTMLFFHILYDL